MNKQMTKVEAVSWLILTLCWALMAGQNVYFQCKTRGLEKMLKATVEECGRAWIEVPVSDELRERIK